MWGWAPPPEAPRAAQRRVEEAEGKSPLAHHTTKAPG